MSTRELKRKMKLNGLEYSFMRDKCGYIIQSKEWYNFLANELYVEVTGDKNNKDIDKVIQLLKKLSYYYCTFMFQQTTYKEALERELGEVTDISFSVLWSKGASKEELVQRSIKSLNVFNDLKLKVDQRNTGIKAQIVNVNWNNGATILVRLDLCDKEGLTHMDTFEVKTELVLSPYTYSLYYGEPEKLEQFAITFMAKKWIAEQNFSWLTKELIKDKVLQLINKNKENIKQLREMSCIY